MTIPLMIAITATASFAMCPITYKMGTIKLNWENEGEKRWMRWGFWAGLWLTLIVFTIFSVGYSCQIIFDTLHTTREMRERAADWFLWQMLFFCIPTVVTAIITVLMNRKPKVG